VLNAANEVAVELFLNDRIGCLAMSDLVERCLRDVSFVASPTLDDLFASDAEARTVARKAMG
jgi:1-deoxy-D-xylulose-5-phosphate reductoisomerase